MPRRPQGDGRRSLSSVCRWLQDAKRAGARRSGQHATGGSPAPRRAIARREGRRAGPRGLRVVRLRGRPGGRQEHLDPPAPPAVLRVAHGEDRGRGRARRPGRPRPLRRADAAAETESAAGEGNADESDAAAASKGHGRNGAEAYRGAERIDVPHPSLTRGRRLSRLRRGHRLREGPGRAGADHRAAAAGGDGLPVAEAALPSVRPGLHRGRARRGRPERSTTPRPAA